MEFTTLNTQILSSPVLKNAIEDMVERTGALNLVTPDWKNVLHNDDLFKKHAAQQIKFSQGTQKGQVVLRNIIGQANCPYFITAGTFTLAIPELQQQKVENDPVALAEMKKSLLKETTIINRNCETLTEYGKCMAESTRWKLADNCRLFVESCDAAFCVSCKRAEARLPPEFRSKQKWCIRKTRVFNGESLKHMFKSSVEDIFAGGSFVGVLLVQITSLFTYGDNYYKISCKCPEMILFKESTLAPHDLELDIDMPCMITYPTITFPKEEEEEIDDGIPLHSLPKRIKSE